MRTIELLGPGCNNCIRLEKNAREAVPLAGVEAAVVYVTDYKDIMARGVMSAPALVVDGKVVCVGRTSSAGDIAEILLVRA